MNIYYRWASPDNLEAKKSHIFTDDNWKPGNTLCGLQCYTSPTGFLDFSIFPKCTRCLAIAEKNSVNAHTRFEGTQLFVGGVRVTPENLEKIRNTF